MLRIDCISGDNIEKTQKSILEQIEAITRGDFTDDDIANAKLYISDMVGSVGDSGSSLSNWHFKQTILDDFITTSEEVKRINEVTRERIIQAAKSVKLDTIYILTTKREVLNNGETNHHQ